MQDVLAFVHFDASIARNHIIRAAGRQFPEGDVQHWWHEPGGEGVRTRIQDDRLWLVYTALEYSRVTGDWTIFDDTAPLISQRAPGPEEASVYETPARLDDAISIYEHCTRAIARTMPTGAHGLPLMGTGDWNDGMDEVGEQGRGESVWLGWFLASLLGPFAAYADSRGDAQLARTYRAHAARLKDGRGSGVGRAWYRRAYFDDGTPLGSAQNVECRIDSIAQSWSVISGLGDPARSQQAMASVESQLIDRERRLILLLTPPFDKAEPIRATSRGMCLGYVRTAANTRMPRFGSCSHRRCCGAEMPRTSCSASSIRSTGRPIVTASSDTARSPTSSPPTSIRHPATPDEAAGPGTPVPRDGCIASRSSTSSASGAKATC